MPVPSPRNPILPARGNYADLLANVATIQDGEICYAIDQNTIYMKEGSTLIEAGTAGGGAIVAATAPTTRDDGSDLQDGDQWYETDTGSLYVRYSVAWQQVVDGGQVVVNTINGQSGTVTLDADDIDDSATTNKFITAADQGKLDGIEAGAQVNVVDSVAGYTGDVTLELTDLTNVSNTVPSANEVLAYNGLAWVPTAGTPADISSSSINGLNDVDTNTWPPNNGEVLAWNSTEGAWIPAAGDTAWTAVAAGISYTDGSVGIGTTNPGKDLHISSAAGGIRLQDSDLTNTFSDIFQSGTALYLDTRADTNAGQTIFRQWNGTAQSEVMRLSAAGNVGIGTSNPLSPLHVVNASAGGALLLESTASSNCSIYMGNTGTSNSFDQSISFKSGDFSVGTGNLERMRITSTGNVGIGTSSPTQKLEVNGAVLASNYRVPDTGGTISGSNSENGAAIQIFDNAQQLRLLTNGSERMRIDSAGNVGIGTSSPEALLHVDEGTIPANDTPEVKISAFRPTIRLHDRSTSANSAEICGDNALIFRCSVPVDDNTALTERMRIDSAGKVGIGTSNPVLAATHINQGANSFALNLQEGSTANAKILFTDTTGGTGGTAIEGAPDISGGFLGFTAGNTERMRIDSAGNVGIGTSSPDSAFHVYKQTNDRTARFQRISTQYIDVEQNASVNRISGTGKSFYLGSTDTNPLILQTAATERMRITSTGNVGIGTSNPGYKLDILGGAENTYLRIRPNSTDSHISGVLFGDAAAAAPGQINYAHNDDSLRVNVNGSERMRIDSTGNVGIGTSSPAADLHVAGGGQIRVDNSALGSNVYGDILSESGTFVLRSRAGGATAGSIAFRSWDGTTDSERMRIKSDGIVNVGNTPVYADNTAAKAGGLVDGDIYRKSDGTLMIVYT